MLQAKRPRPRLCAGIFALLSLAVCGAVPCAAQSSDISYPAPIFSDQVAGRIAPRDIGDARRTRHFYIFRGTEGDLVVNVESTELSGDVDIFTATTLRPLVKVTLYGGTATKATKSVFLRREETLILRVEARAAGETEGSYRISFGGSFAPAPAGLAQAPETPAPEATADTRRRGNTRRVTSTGARIEEPRVEVQPAEEASAAPTPTPSETTGERAEETPQPPRRGTPRARRGRGTTRNTPSRTTTPRGDTTPAEAATGAEAGAPSTAPSNPPAENPGSNTRTRTPPRRRAAPRRAARTETPTPAPADTAPAAEAPSPRLIIVTKDGETVEREMSTVRRVTVENNQVVVVTRDGKTIRQPMTNVLKMSIEP
jgi:hypothetical protein